MRNKTLTVCRMKSLGFGNIKWQLLRHLQFLVFAMNDCTKLLSVSFLQTMKAQNIPTMCLVSISDFFGTSWLRG